MIKFSKIFCTIPFHFTNNYNQIITEIKASGVWSPQDIITGENDLYDYIANLIGKEEDGTQEEMQIAYSWILHTDFLPKDSKGASIDFVIVEKDKHIPWNMEQLGLIVFKNGIAILWYQIKPKSARISLEDIELLQYKIKEFSYDNIFVQFNEAWSIELKEKVQAEADLILLEEIPKPDKKDKNRAKDSKEKESLPIRLIYGKATDFFTTYISPLLDKFEEKDYFATQKIGPKKDIIVPDRSIIFSVAYEMVSNFTEDYFYQNAYLMGRVYKNSYKMAPGEKQSNFYRGFADSIWYASREGCANFLCTEEENLFYSGTYKGRIDTYFYVYLLCLGQYYSLLQLTKEVAELSTDEKKYKDSDEPINQMIDKIRVFNLKNNYSQVGHLTPHNEFYEYLQNRLGINTVQKELEVELQSLYDMIERKSSIRQANNYKVITIIGGIFVVLQAFINVAAMYGSAMSKEWGYFIFATIGCIVLAILGVILWLIDRNKHRKK